MSDRQKEVVALVIIAILMLAFAKGCSFPGGPVASSPYNEITIECRDLLGEAQAKDDTTRHLSSAAVGLAATIAGADPLGVMIAYGLSHVATAAVEQGKSGLYETQVIRVPVAEGTPSCVIRDASGTIIVLTGAATATALDDGLPEGLPPEDAALWRRMLGAATIKETGDGE